MSRKTKATPSPDGPAIEAPPLPSRRDAAAAPAESVERIRTSAALVVMVLLVAVTWMVHRPIGDMYVALAAGRDIVDGKLGQPDDWSYLTTDRVWINQNWGTHLTYYLTYSAGGERGMLVLKAVILLVLVGAIILSGRQRQVRWSTAILVAGAMLIAGRSYIDPRPNLTTLMMAPLMMWLLYRTRNHPRRVVWAVLVAWAWASSHGGFIFGLGMMGLWTLCRMGQAVLQKGLQPGVKETWPLAAGTAGAILLSMVSPFGLENLMHPFLIAGSEKWRQVSEWRPLLDETATFGSKWEFLTILAVLLAVLVIRLILQALPGSQDTGRREGAAATGRAEIGTWVFEGALSLVVTAMAFKSRRFVPLAAVVLAPVMAVQLDRLLRRLPQMIDAAVFALIAVALVVPATAYGRHLSMHYRKNHPSLPDESVFKRMVATHQLCPTLAEFVNANQISGRVFQEWRWEGFLRWKCPQLKVTVGGRAQQVYTEKQDERRLAMLHSPLAPYLLREDGLHMILIPNFGANPGQYTQLLDSIGLLHPSSEKLSKWVYLYCDDDSMMIVDTSDPDMARLVELADEGKLEYPSPFAEAFSLAMRRKGRDEDPHAIFDAFAAANEHRVTYRGYQEILGLVTEADQPEQARLIQRAATYFDKELSRLTEMDPIRPNGLQIPMAGNLVAVAMRQIHRMNGQPAKANQAGELAEAFKELADRLLEPYR